LRHICCLTLWVCRLHLCLCSVGWSTSSSGCLSSKGRYYRLRVCLVLSIGSILHLCCLSTCRRILPIVLGSLHSRCCVHTACQYWSALRCASRSLVIWCGALCVGVSFLCVIHLQCCNGLWLCTNNGYNRRLLSLNVQAFDTMQQVFTCGQGLVDLLYVTPT